MKLTFRTAVRCVIVARRFHLDLGAKRCYMLDRSVDAETIRTIDMDLPRTVGREPFVYFQMGRIRAMLLRQAAEDPQLGYCQGMNFVAAVFATASQSQGEAYERFHTFTTRLRGLWLPGFPLLKVATNKFVLLTQKKLWYKHLETHTVEPSMFLPQAVITMLALWLPISTIAQCLQLLEQHGLDGILAMTISVLDHNKKKLLRQQSMEGLLQVLKDLPDYTPQLSVLKMSFHGLMNKNFVMHRRELLWSQKGLTELFSKSVQEDDEEGNGSNEPKWWFTKQGSWPDWDVDGFFNGMIPRQVNDKGIKINMQFGSSCQAYMDGLLQQLGVYEIINPEKPASHENLCGWL